MPDSGATTSPAGDARQHVEDSPPAARPQRRAQPPPGERAHHRRPRGRRGAASQAPPRLALLLLGLLALAGIIALIAALGGDDDGDAGRGAGNLSAGGTQLLPVPGDGLARSSARTCRLRDVVVQSVVRGQKDPDALEGFSVGSGAQDRVYVEWGGDVGSDEASYTPNVGEKVQLSGPVRPAPENPEQTLNLNAADAELVRSQGGYVNADEVEPTG